MGRKLKKLSLSSSSSSYIMSLIISVDDLLLRGDMPPPLSSIYKCCYPDNTCIFSYDILYSCHLVHKPTGKVVALSGNALLDNHLKDVIRKYEQLFNESKADYYTASNITEMTLQLSAVLNAKKHSIEYKDYNYYHNTVLLVDKTFKKYKVSTGQTIREYMFTEGMKYLADMTNDSSYILYAYTDGADRFIFSKEMIRLTSELYKKYHIDRTGKFVSYYLIV
jgi:hypothetical protein